MAQSFAWKRCKHCASLSEARIKAVNSDEKFEVQQQLRHHRDEVAADRQSGLRSNLISEDHSNAPSHDGMNQVIKFSIDGMDKSKFRDTRNLASSATLESCWRPDLHLCGAIAHGYIEAYFIMGPSQPKYSSMNATVLFRMFDLVQELRGPDFVFSP